MDIDDVVQGIKKLIRTPLFTQNGTTSGHLVRLDPLNTLRETKNHRVKQRKQAAPLCVTSSLDERAGCGKLTYLVRRVRKAAGGEE